VAEALPTASGWSSELWVFAHLDGCIEAVHVDVSDAVRGFYG
jgi:hypothetical protein